MSYWICGVVLVYSCVLLLDMIGLQLKLCDSNLKRLLISLFYCPTQFTFGKIYCDIKIVYGDIGDGLYLGIMNEISYEGPVWLGLLGWVTDFYPDFLGSV